MTGRVQRLLGAVGERQPDRPGRVDARRPRDQRGVVDVLLEGGPTVAGAFLAAGLVDRVLAYVAPKFLGAGPCALASAGVPTITAAHQFTVEQATMSGRDVRVSAVPVR